VPLHFCVPPSSAAASRGSHAWIRRVVLLRQVVPTVDHHGIMTTSSPGKGVASPSMGASSTSMPRDRDPMVMKLFIKPQSLSLSLMG
jgi:hypothetical protein